MERKGRVGKKGKEVNGEKGGEERRMGQREGRKKEKKREKKKGKGGILCSCDFSSRKNPDPA